MPIPRVFDDIGTIVNLIAGWAQLIFSPSSDPLECVRCRRPFKDGFDITKNLAAHLNARVYCQKCYDPYLKYLDHFENTDMKGDPLSIEVFIKNRDLEDLELDQHIKECFESRQTSTLIIVAATPPNIIDDALPTTNEKKPPTNPSPKQPAVAPFVHIGNGFLAASQVGTSVASGAILDPSDRDKPSCSSSSTALRVPSRKNSPSRSRPPSPSGIAPLRHIGATILRAGKLATHIAVKPSLSSRHSTPPQVPSPRPSSPAPSRMSETTLSPRSATPIPTNDSQTTL